MEGQRGMEPISVHTAHCVPDINIGPSKRPCNATMQRAGIVHRIPAGMCPKIYIVQTGRMLRSAVVENAIDESHMRK